MKYHNGKSYFYCYFVIFFSIFQAPVWIADSRVTMCQACTAAFKMTLRRHHCRAYDSIYIQGFFYTMSLLQCINHIISVLFGLLFTDAER